MQIKFQLYPSQGLMQSPKPPSSPNYNLSYQQKRLIADTGLHFEGRNRVKIGSIFQNLLQKKEKKSHAESIQLNSMNNEGQSNNIKNENISNNHDNSTNNLKSIITSQVIMNLIFSTDAQGKRKKNGTKESLTKEIEDLYSGAKAADSSNEANISLSKKEALAYVNHFFPS